MLIKTWNGRARARRKGWGMMLRTRRVRSTRPFVAAGMLPLPLESKESRKKHRLHPYIHPYVETPPRTWNETHPTHTRQTNSLPSRALLLGARPAGMLTQCRILHTSEFARRALPPPKKEAKRRRQPTDAISVFVRWRYSTQRGGHLLTSLDVVSQSRAVGKQGNGLLPARAART